MEVTYRWLQKVYDEKITEEYDRVVLVIADEGEGKSTLLLQLVWLWMEITGQSQAIETVLDRIVWDQSGFQDALAEAPPRAAIPVPDAARVLHSKESMTSEQVEIQKDFLDARIEEHLILLGFQDWGDVPSFLRNRRAKNAIYIPSRGLIRGYNRASLDEKVEMEKHEWPPADLKDSFDSLEGTELWRRYKARDREQKKQRMQANAEEAEKRERLKSVAAELKDEGLRQVISEHGNTGEPYVDRDLIELEKGLSEPDARKVKKLLERDDDVRIEQYADS